MHAEMSRVIAESGDPSTSKPNLWLVGGGDLVGQFHDRGLLDEIILGSRRCFSGRVHRCCRERSPPRRSPWSKRGPATACSFGSPTGSATGGSTLSRPAGTSSVTRSRAGARGPEAVGAGYPQPAVRNSTGEHRSGRLSIIRSRCGQVTKYLEAGVRPPVGSSEKPGQSAFLEKSSKLSPTPYPARAQRLCVSPHPDRCCPQGLWTTGFTKASEGRTLRPLAAADHPSRGTSSRRRMAVLRRKTMHEMERGQSTRRRWSTVQQIVRAGGESGLSAGMTSV